MLVLHVRGLRGIRGLQTIPHKSPVVHTTANHPDYAHKTVLDANVPGGQARSYASTFFFLFFLFLLRNYLHQVPCITKSNRTLACGLRGFNRDVPGANGAGLKSSPSASPICLRCKPLIVYGIGLGGPFFLVFL